jgi:hypothetical protein
LSLVQIRMGSMPGRAPAPPRPPGPLARPGQAVRAEGAAGGAGSGRRREGAGQALSSRLMAFLVRSYSLVVRGDSWAVICPLCSPLSLSQALPSGNWVDQEWSPPH